jgi:hypothetical protein
MSYRKVKRVFRFIVLSLKYEPYKIDSFEKIEFFNKTNFSLPAGNRNFESVLGNLYRQNFYFLLDPVSKVSQ